MNNIKWLEEVISKMEGEKLNLSRELQEFDAKLAKDQREKSGQMKREALQTQIKARESEIERMGIEVARLDVSQMEKEGLGLAEEYLNHALRMEKIRQDWWRLYESCQRRIPVRRVQVSSRKILKMEKEITELSFAGFTQSDEPVMVGPIMVGAEIKPYIDKKKKIVRVEIPNLKQNIEHAESLGFKLSDGEKFEEEPLTDENSILIPAFAMPEIFYQGL
ncbi:MAG: hypothetical protein ABSH06_03115 [Thermodesulfobacteriota bacterium]